MKKMLETVAVAGITLAIGAVITVPGMFSGHGQDMSTEQADVQDAGWWASIGGCGVSGGAGGGGGAAKWVGRGVTGGLIDMETKMSTTFGGDYFYNSFSSRWSTKFMTSNTVGLSLPMAVKHGTYRYDTNEPPITQTVGGFGDLGLDYSRSFGSTGQASVALAVGIPTGRYNHRRYDRYGRLEGTDKSDVIGSYVTPELQCGTGVWSTGLSAEYSIDKDWGPMIFGVSYSKMLNPANGFSAVGAQNDIWARENFAEDGKDLWGLTDASGYTNYYYIREEEGDAADVLPSGYYKGEELKGDFFGDSFGCNFSIGYKEEKCVHSMSLTYSYKIAKDWYVRISDPDIANNVVTDVAAMENHYYMFPVRTGGRHNFTVGYGLEISDMYFPVFLAGGMAFDENQINNFTLTLGVKGSFL